jgi:hypothetical protein
MDPDTREQFRTLRSELREFRADTREDVRGIYARIDEHSAAINRRCARRGEEIAVLGNRERERQRRIDRRIALGLALVTALSLLLGLIT